MDGWVCKECGMCNDVQRTSCFSCDYVRTKAKHSPVTVEELKEELKRLFQYFEVGDGKTFGFRYMAAHLLTKFKIERKG